MTEWHQEIHRKLRVIGEHADRTGNREYVDKIMALLDYAQEALAAGRTPPDDAKMKAAALLGADNMGKYHDKRTLH
jgi:hypothetical protein